MLEWIINSNKHLSRENALNLGVILLYAPRNCACEMTERVIKLYIKISKKLDFKLELILYSVIGLMFDAYFDDEKKYGELISMVDSNTSSDVIDDFSPFDGFKESLEYANRRISELETENSRIPELEAKIKELESQVNGK